MSVTAKESSWWSDHVWPIGITIGLLCVVAVNVVFIVLAVGGADEVAEAYEAGER
jgi:hypothetical protein